MNDIVKIGHERPRCIVKIIHGKRLMKVSTANTSLCCVLLAIYHGPKGSIVVKISQNNEKNTSKSQSCCTHKEYIMLFLVYGKVKLMSQYQDFNEVIFNTSIYCDGLKIRL